MAAFSPEVKPGDVKSNVAGIIDCLKICTSERIDVAVFPELSVTGYTCADLFGQSLLLRQAREGLSEIIKATEKKHCCVIVGAPIERDNRLYNCAVVIQCGEICGIVPKSYLPNYGEFYEKRWFESGKATTGQIDTTDIYGWYDAVVFGTDLIFTLDDCKFGIELCEDLWVPIPPSSNLAMGGADIIFNLSASNELIGKHRYLVDLIRNQSARCRCGYVYASAGPGESSTDLAFAGNCIIAENGTLLAESKRFEVGCKYVIADIDIDTLRHDRRHFGTFHEEGNATKYRTIYVKDDARSKKPFENCDGYEKHRVIYNSDYDFKYRKIKAHPFLDENPEAMAERCDEISSIQAWGLMTRLRAINCRHAVVGISGGLDSTLALLVTAKAFDMLGYDRKGIIGVTMPGFGTTDRTKSNASKLMDLLGVTQREIPIGKAVEQHFKDIDHDPEVRDVTYENSQARERTQILMDIANQAGGIVIGTGDLSELALGWCTYNGDQMSMYGVNASIPKTLVKYLVDGYAVHAANSGNQALADVLKDIIDTPISPELLPPTADDNIEQKTEDLVGPYELHDFFMYHMLRYGLEPHKILRMAVKAFEDKYDEDTIGKWLKTYYRRFMNQQFKRSCMPDGVKAGSICLSPRGDWRMPSDAKINVEC